MTEDTLPPPDLGIAAIIPLYNGAKYIREALTSVLAQHLPPSEIVVVDDGSTDDGPRIVAEMAAMHPIRLLHKQNGGQASARNFGVAATTSRLIALLDQDDIWYPDHLQELAEPFHSRSNVPLGWVYSNLDEIDEPGNVIARAILSSDGDRHPKRTLIACLREDMFMLPSASLISRAAFESVGGFDEQLRGYEDDDLFLRLFHAGFDNVYVDKPLSQWRIYPSSASYSPQMAKSRMVYATRLLNRFPDDPDKNQFFARDLVAPRFHPQMVEECRKALGSGDDDAIQASFANLQFIAGFLPPNQRHSTDAAGCIVSAIIPLYNGAVHIEQAIRSMLEQTVLPAEIIVVDDGSTDHGAQIVEHLAARRPAKVPVRLLRQANGGQSAARNLGVRHAHGDLIAFLDQDDAWYPDHLEKLAKPFQEPQSRQLGWVYSNLDEVDENGTMVTRSFLSTFGTQHPKRELVACLREDMFVLPSASLISRAAFESVGGFDEQLRGYEDDDLFLRLFHAGFDNVYVDKPLSQWRIYPGSASYSPQMVKSRIVYATRLLNQFPDDPDQNQFFARDLVAPRFYPQMVEECRKALGSGDDDAIQTSFANLQFIAGFLPPNQRHSTDTAGCIVSAIIPLYNGALYIEQAIRSMLEQTELPAEIIVVDDGSTDQGAQIVEHLAASPPAKVPIRLLRQANGGQSSARNLGVRHAHGDLIAFLDQDDAWYPDHLEKLTKSFQEPQSRQLGWVYSNLDEVDENGTMVTRSFLSTFGTQHPKRELVACLREDMYVLPSASVISRRAFLSVGGFDEQLMGYEDDDLFLRLFRRGYENVFIDEPLSQWRIHTSGSSYSWRMARSRMIYAKKLLDEFPNDPERERYFRRDALAPRFFAQMISDYRKALRRGDRAEIRSALANLRFISRFLRLRLRLLLFVVLPAFASPPLAKVLFAFRGILRTPVRRVFRS